MTVLPLAMAEGAARMGQIYRRVLVRASVVWALSAPVFFFLPDDVDGIYERYLGVIAMTVVLTLSAMFIKRARELE